MVAPHSTRRPVALLVVALLACSCGDVTVPSLTTPTATPARGTPAHLELSAVPGVGPTGGAVAVSARAQDVTGATVPNVSIAFSTSVGAFSATPVITDDQGIARTTLAAPAGTAQITATAGTLTSPMVTVSVQPQTAAPTTPPTCQPACDPSPTPSPSPTGPLAVRMSATATTLGTSTVFAAAVDGAGGQNFTWDFGDGARVDGFSPTSAHTYAVVGSYPATVIVRDTFGRIGSAGATAVVSAAPTVPPPPGPSAQYVIALTASPLSVNTGVATTLTATVTTLFGSTPPTSFAFDCGGHGAANPAAGSGNTASCTYATAGTVTASVTATNGTTTGSGVATVTVTAAPAPVIPVIAVNCSGSISTVSGTIAAPATLTSCNVSATLSSVPVNPSNITITGWQWGDGASGTAAIVQSHQYAVPSGTAGFHPIVTATVVGGGGAGTGSGTTVVQ